ncbi:MAG: hypothetical protein L0Y56_07215, partial [Nitrospira sp.]|nr:hypothetical protein [Nitrospira sp.]
PIERARNVRELKNCGLILLDKKIEAKKKKVGSAAGWKSLVSYAAINGRKLGYAVHMYKARYGSLPWLDRLEATLPKGKQWELSAKDWLSIKEV